jgi:hypothetical protein
MNPLRLKSAYVYSVSAGLILLTAIFANGCIPVFIPTPPHGVRVITEDTVESLKPGQSTRADVLHLLGDPIERTEEDRFFVYGWGSAWGYYALFIYPPLGPDPRFDPIGERRGLIIQFRSDNRVRRLQFIKYDDWKDTFERWAKEMD